jgi:hypothetical protein
LFAEGLALSAQLYVIGGDLEWGEDYFTKALKVNPIDKLVKQGLADLKEMSRT